MQYLSATNGFEWLYTCLMFKIPVQSSLMRVTDEGYYNYCALQQERAIATSTKYNKRQVLITVPGRAILSLNIHNSATLLIRSIWSKDCLAGRVIYCMIQILRTKSNPQLNWQKEAKIPHLYQLKHRCSGNSTDINGCYLQWAPPPTPFQDSTIPQFWNSAGNSNWGVAARNTTQQYCAFNVFTCLVFAGFGQSYSNWCCYYIIQYRRISCFVIIVFVYLFIFTIVCVVYIDKKAG